MNEISFVKLSTVTPDQVRKWAMKEIGIKAKIKIFNYLRDLGDNYPEFDKWYFEKVISEVEENDGKRDIIIALNNSPNSMDISIVGIAILKRTENEKKICTIRIHEDFRNQGFGQRLFEECFEYLNTRRPIISISEDRLDMFENIITKYNFILKQKLSSYYRDGLTEYVFNGELQ